MPDPSPYLFPPITPLRTGMLQVDARHTLYWEQSGNPEGVPVVFLHGGPGAGSAPVPARPAPRAPYPARSMRASQRGGSPSTQMAA